MESKTDIRGLRNVLREGTPMGRSKTNTNTLFMIVAGHRKETTPEGRYITSDGAVTSLRSRAAKFKTAADAKTFANVREMPLGDRLYIGKRKRY